MLIGMLSGKAMEWIQTILTNEGGLNLGTWQGIYICEHRNHGGARRLVVTVYGERR